VPHTTEQPKTRVPTDRRTSGQPDASGDSSMDKLLFEDRRSRWRVIVLIIVLFVVFALIWLGEDTLSAVGAAFLIFLLAAHAIRWVIDGRGLPAIPDMLTGVSRGNTDAPTTPDQTSASTTQSGMADGTGKENTA